MDKQLIDLYDDCKAAVRLFDYMHQVCSNFETRRPPELADHIEAAEVFTYRDMKRTLMESLTKEDAYDLANFVAVLLDRYPRLLYELGDDKSDDEEEQEET
jgi:hypothetical protein